MTTNTATNNFDTTSYNRIRELRKERGYTLRQFASMAGYSPTRQSKMEHARRLSRGVIRRTAKLLGVDPLELYVKL